MFALDREFAWYTVRFDYAYDVVEMEIIENNKHPIEHF